MPDRRTPAHDDRPERVNVFRFGRYYLFRHYFDGEAVFEELKHFYNNQQYRFEVPKREFQDLREFLGVYGYKLIIVMQPEPYVVVVKKYSAHPENIFTSAVAQTSVEEYNCFLLADSDAVERAVNDGAIRLSQTDLDPEFEPLS